jgi:hypothetical protein
MYLYVCLYIVDVLYNGETDAWMLLAAVTAVAG